MTDNPFLNSKVKYGLPQFDKFSIVYIKDAVIENASIFNQKLLEIATSVQRPDFNNTILEYQKAFCEYEYINKQIELFVNIVGSQDVREAYIHGKRESRNVVLDKNHFADLAKRVNEVFEQSDQKFMSKGEFQLLTDIESIFCYKGTSDISVDNIMELQALGQRFSTNVKKAKEQFRFNVTNKEDLSGLSEESMEVFRQQAIRDGLDGWSVDYHHIFEVLRNCDSRETRKRLMDASQSICREGEYSNDKIIRRIIELRNLGNRSGCILRTIPWLFDSQDKVTAFIRQIAGESMSACDYCHSGILDTAKKNGFQGERIEAWDRTYWLCKTRGPLITRTNTEEESLSKYLQIDVVIKGVVSLSEHLYGITLKETDYPTLSKDVKVYEVFDEDRSILGIIYFDLIARKFKKHINRCVSLKYFDKCYSNGRLRALYVNTNIENPECIDTIEVKSILHEFGHALHFLFSEKDYIGQKAENYELGEVPSTIMERFAYHKEFYTNFVNNNLKGERIPESILEKVKSSRYSELINLQCTVESTLTDMYWSTIAEVPDGSILDQELKQLNEAGVIPLGSGTSLTFEHIFAGPYLGQYYIYLLADALIEDIYSIFIENGLMNPDIWKKFRKQFLTKCTQDPHRAYLDFAGREPDLSKLGDKIRSLRRVL